MAEFRGFGNWHTAWIQYNYVANLDKKNIKKMNKFNWKEYIKSRPNLKKNWNGPIRAWIHYNIFNNIFNYLNDFRIKIRNKINQKKKYKLEKLAYFTLCNDEFFVDGAFALGCSLRETKTKYPVVCLINNLSEKSINRLKLTGMQIIETSAIDWRQDASAKFDKPLRVKTFDKLAIWNQIQYTKGVYIDADCLVLRNVDELFGMEELSVCGDQQYFNSGVMVFRPSQDLFKEILLTLKNRDYEPNPKSGHTEQDSLISFFGKRKLVKTILQKYNFRPIKKGEGPCKDMAIIHYIGNPKPWGFQSGQKIDWDENRLQTAKWCFDLWNAEYEKYSKFYNKKSKGGKK